jgi:pimeloyl-ACP methyl ester carboxylesterase
MPAEPWRRRALSGVGTALDATMMRAMTTVVHRALLPKPENVESLRATFAASLSQDIQASPRRAFDFLDEPSQPLAVATREHRRVGDGVVVRMRMATGYRPYGFEAAARTDPARAAHPLLCEHWMHDARPPQATVIALHGFAMGWPRFDSIALFARRWFDAGLDVALPTLPYHGARTPADAHFSGDRFAVPNVARLGESVREAIYEIQMLVRWIREHSGAPVGILGLSLGGYLSALLAGLTDEPDFVVPMVPPVCFGDLAWRIFARTPHARAGGSAAMTGQELRSAFRFHSPLAHALRTPRERLLIVAGRGDRVVPPEHPHALWEHWNRPAIHWFSGSHIAPFGRGRIVAAVLAHLRSLGIL